MSKRLFREPRLPQRFKEEVFSLLFPGRCPVCDEVLAVGQQICRPCRPFLLRAREPVCMRCGKPLESERVEYCPDCAAGKHLFRQGRAVFLYGGHMKSSLYRFKYHGRQEYARFYASEAAVVWGQWMKSRGIEAIVPIPMYRPKERVRGYNQAKVFARALSITLGIPMLELVRRVRDTVPQKELNHKERKHNLKNAFQLQTDIVKYKRVLLADDIYTTGSTMDAVTEVLLRAGVVDVYFICISIGEGA